MQTEAMESLLVELHPMIREVDAMAFKEATLDLTQRLVPFDSAIWFEGRLDGQIDPHTACLHRLPMEALQTHMRHASMNRFIDCIRIHPGEVIDPFATLYRKEALNKHDSGSDHCRAYDLQAGLGMVYRVAEAGVFSYLGFYRGESSPGFLERERRDLECFLPHVVECYQNCVFISAALAAGSSTGRVIAAAVIDSCGRVYFTTREFEEIVSRAGEGWDGAQVPATVLNELQDGKPCIGNDFIYRIRPARHDMHLLSLIPTPQRWRLLSPCERAIALHLAQGESYKLVARAQNISPSTVTNHVNSIYRKLGVGSKSELARYLSELTG